MKKMLIVGAGKIGALVACLLGQTEGYEITLSDKDLSGSDLQNTLKALPQLKTCVVDVQDPNAMSTLLKAQTFDGVISCLPYFLNEGVAQLCNEHHLHYFDLTEDTKTTAAVKSLAKNAKTAFVPQCGLAPGFISIVANSLMEKFNELDAVKLRVGALPQYADNALHYALTWSTDGLINEYGNACHGVLNGKAVKLHPLEGLENIQIDGLSYEAFNTSGGLGSLAELYEGRVNRLNYKTIRYPGHCEKMRMLMFDLKLNEDRDTLKKILERAIPKSYQDVVLVYVSVTGQRQGTYAVEQYTKKLYPQTIANNTWTAIQVTTAAGLCAIVDMVMENESRYKGFVQQESFPLEDFLKNRFGRYYA